MWSDALLYELEFADDPEFDVPFWTGLCSRLGVTRMLEPACGTGRLTIPLARAGVSVVGFDLSEAFLVRARERLARYDASVASRVSLSVGDMCAPPAAVAEAGPFDLVAIAFSSLAYLYTREDQEACLRAMRGLVAEGGHFAFDLIAPHMNFLADAMQTCQPVRIDADHPAPEQGLARVLRHFTDHYDATTQTLRSVNTYTLVAEDGSVETRVGETRWHMYFPLELEALLERCGFRVTERWGGYDLRSWTGHSPRYVWLCEPA